MITTYPLLLSVVNQKVSCFHQIKIYGISEILKAPHLFDCNSMIHCRIIQKVASIVKSDIFKGRNTATKILSNKLKYVIVANDDK